MDRFFLMAVAGQFFTAPPLAHLNPSEHGSFMVGLAHPVFGLDHLLAMVTVGLWGAALGGRARWALPGAFVGCMVLGFAAAVLGFGLPWVEPMLLVSVFVFGLAVALALRLPVGVAAGVVGLFGLFHGHAHGGELGAASELGYGAGFAVSTAILHLCGLAMATLAGRSSAGLSVRKGLGWAAFFGGVWVTIGG